MFELLYLLLNLHININIKCFSKLFHWEWGQASLLGIFLSWFELLSSNFQYDCFIPRWSRGNVLASSSKVRGFKPGWGRWIFQDLKILSTSPPEGTLSLGSLVWDFRLVKKPQAWNNRPLSNILSAYSRSTNT